MTAEAPTLTADAARCVGAGHCVRSAPDVFDQSEEGTVVLLRPDAPASEAVLDALDLCPSGAIRAARPYSGGDADD